MGLGGYAAGCLLLWIPGPQEWPQVPEIRDISQAPLVEGKASHWLQGQALGYSPAIVSTVTISSSSSCCLCFRRVGQGKCMARPL